MFGKNLQSYLDNEIQQDPKLAKRLSRLRLYFSIATQISRARKGLKLTQSDLAKRLETTQPNIARWETPGYDRYSISKLLDISEALGLTLEIRFVARGNLTQNVSWDDNNAVLGTLRKYTSQFNGTAPPKSSLASFNSQQYKIHKMETYYA